MERAYLADEPWVNPDPQTWPSLELVDYFERQSANLPVVALAG
jgi:hypothetical protein